MQKASTRNFNLPCCVIASPSADGRSNLPFSNLVSNDENRVKQSVFFDEIASPDESGVAMTCSLSEMRLLRRPPVGGLLAMTMAFTSLLRLVSYDETGFYILVANEDEVEFDKARCILHSA